MTSILEPEIIPPRRASSTRGLNDESLDQLARVLDDIFRIPGTGIRFGLDPIIGLIPGIGDVLTGVVSFLIIFAAWERGLPRVTLARMVANVAIDTLVGSMPIFGDFFDAVWKSNRMNYNLLVRADQVPPAKAATKDWLFLSLLLLVIAVLVGVPTLVVLLIFHLLQGRSI